MPVIDRINFEAITEGIDRKESFQKHNNVKHEAMNETKTDTKSQKAPSMPSKKFTEAAYHWYEPKNELVYFLSSALDQRSFLSRWGITLIINFLMIMARLRTTELGYLCTG